MEEVALGKLISKIAFKRNTIDGILDWDLENLNQINLFIGPNNSGKSRLIRKLFTSEFAELTFDYQSPSIDEINDVILSSLEEFTLTYEYSRSQFLARAVDRLRGLILNNKSKLNLLDNYSDILEQFFSKEDSLRNVNYNEKQYIETNFFQEVFENDSKFKRLIKLVNTDWKKCYIPTLRTLRSLSLSEQELCFKRTVNDYFEGKENLYKTDSISIFTGETIYDELQKFLLGEHSKREKVKEYEEYLSLNFFFGKEVSLVPRISDDVVYFKEGELEERPIYDLGDGIQSIIILTFRIFMASEPTIFVIEEPEHFLHAGLQRRLLETFSKDKKHMFFISTHSNHFLDFAQESNDVSVQHCQRENKETKVQSVVEMQDTLTSLGVRASSVLLANCSIWVEGITDRLYLSYFLKKYIAENPKDRGYLESLKENLHFIFVEYQGGNITHWSFAENENGAGIDANSLSNNIYLIADADIKEKGERVENLQNKLTNNFDLLERKEIENYLPKRVIIEVAKRRFELMKNKTKQGCTIDRFENIKDDAFNHPTEGIGRILDRYVAGPKGSKNLFSEKSGTIKEKVKFCHSAIEIMKNDSEFKLTSELNKICKKIWSFIEKSNNSEFDSK